MPQTLVDVAAAATVVPRMAHTVVSETGWRGVGLGEEGTAAEGRVRERVRKRVREKVLRVRLSGACSKPLSAYRCGLPRLKLDMGPVVMRGGGGEHGNAAARARVCQGGECETAR